MHPPASLLSSDTDAPALGAALRRLHAALDPRQLWQALRSVAREAVAHDALLLEIATTAEGRTARVYRHALPSTPAMHRELHPARAWLADNPGVRAFQLSSVPRAATSEAAQFEERVMRREGWDKQLSVVGWRGRAVLGLLSFHRAAAGTDFTARDLRIAEALQPYFETALARVLAHEEAISLGDRFASMLEDVPVGLLLLDWELRPLWFNGEGAHVCAVWNHGERRAAALNPQRSFRVPAPLADACADMRAHWGQSNGQPAGSPRTRVVSEDAIGLHAQIVLRAPTNNPLARPAFEIQLDYRRPRGDRNRPLSPGAVALLARLSAREREVAMRVREGLRTAEIAAELRRSPLTIKTQLAAIFSKLEVRSRTRVAALLNR